MISRIEQLLQASHPQSSLFDNDQPLDELLEIAAQRYAALIIHKQSQPVSSTLNENALKITWERTPHSNKKDELSGIYCLRSNVTQWSEKTLWETYVMLTDLEATFRSLKTELGLRPVYHQKEERVSAHLLITLLAYYLVHTLRVQLKQKEIHISWQFVILCHDNNGSLSLHRLRIKINSLFV